MEIIRTKAFEKQFERLPGTVQLLCLKQSALLSASHQDPRLHAKPVKGQSGMMSFRVTRRYRGFFYLNEHSQAIFFSILPRKDAY